MTLASRLDLSSIAPYQGGKSTINGRRFVIKLSSNEGALGPGPDALTAYREHEQTIHRYPDGSCLELRKTIAVHYRLKRDQIVCGAGSDELLSLLCRIYAGPGDEVLYSEYGFLMYPIIARTVGAIPVKAPEKNLKTDIDSLLESVSAKTRILFIANPNNPTGSYLNKDELKNLREKLRDDILLVIDSAYADFVTTKDYSAGFELVNQYQNVAVTQTFSKIFALGGLRLGWTYCPQETASFLNRIRAPFNVSSVAQVTGVAALRDTVFTDKVRSHTAQWRLWTTNQLKTLKLSVVPSVANFILLHLPKNTPLNAEACDQHLKSKNIIVRRMEAYGLSDYLRITIGTENEMKTFVAAMGEFTDIHTG